VGTYQYMPPELIKRLSNKKGIMSAPLEPSPAMDMWSAGVCLFKLLSGQNPFGVGVPSQILANIVKESNYDMGHQIWEVVSDTSKDLVNKILVRATFLNVLHNIWLWVPDR